MNVCIYLQWVVFMCGGHLPSSHLPSLRESPLIAVGERDRTHALHGEILYPSTSSAAPDAFARASVGAPQVAPRLVHVYVLGGKWVIIEKCVRLCMGA